ncbi:hypothetical protein GH714_001833 [Hevea brasiliensis]|uniref:Serine carboxypeptidase S28 family protein n=1 Tax=Hevea brasiliensis TaxID=3981 RepID=A0A6A6NBR6_HEVBR|nr:hypothetical protein GH714_001833 [Hevea brasiliensis]
MALPSFQLWLALLLLAAVCASAMHPRKLTRLGGLKRLTTSKSSSDLPPEYEIHHYRQTLDHFNYKPESYATFQQRYILNYKYWGGANTSSPIFVYTGEEGEVTDDVETFIIALAARFKGLLLYIEHRYYGESMPFGSENQAFQNSSTLGYLSSEQALADYAQVIVHVKKNLSAENCPAIAVGASYGGNGYDVVVTKDFKQETSESCYNTIKQSWSEIDRVAAEPNGLTTLSNLFNTCSPLTTSQELKDYLGFMYEDSAQYDNPPDYPVQNTCRGIDGAPEGTDILGRIVAGLSSLNMIQLFFPCIFQTCTEIVMPMGRGNETMFEAEPFDMEDYTKECVDDFGVDIKTVLGNFASNIIFSNGLRDPFSIGGVLENISDSVVAIHTDRGAHCLDLLSPTRSDPAWLVDQRDKEIKIIAFWLEEYYAKLASKTRGRTG